MPGYKHVLLVLGCLVAGAVGLLGSCAVLSVVTMPWNPMLLMFLEDFEVVNESGQRVTVTPIGPWDSTDEWSPLPQYTSEDAPARPVSGSGAVTLAPGESRSIIYDWDDIAFRALLVQATDGDVFIIWTDAGETCCSPPARDSYAIPPLDEAEKCPDGLQPLLQDEDVQWSVSELD